MRPGSGSSRAEGSAGFVLVGVIVMVLALTILGLSLFSLSSYEAQFLNRSVDDQQALQYAMGGLDRARFALTASPQMLSNVKQNLPYENVTYARAMQDKGGPVADSMGVVLGSGNDVRITVESEYRGIRKRVSGNYIPVVQTNYYKRLMTVAAGGILVNDKTGASGWPSCATVFLGTLLAPDSVWVNQPGGASFNCASLPGLTYFVNRRYVPVPSVASFLSAHPPGAGVTTVDVSGNPAQIDLLGTSGVIRYWYSNDPTKTFSVHKNTGALTIQVNGLAVWMLPRGFRADGNLTIKSGGDPNACLVVIARNGFDPSTPSLVGAFWPFAGFDARIPLILVTDGAVKLESFNQVAAFCRADNLSIFANEVLLTGPTSDPTANPSATLMTLSYGASRMNPIIDQLMDADALPNAVSARPFALRAGTWRIDQ